MPRGDRTGPRGMGPMTGRAAGYCGGYGMPGYANQIPGRGVGMGFGGGRGFGGRRGGFGGRCFGGGGWGWQNWFGASSWPGFGAQAMPQQQLTPEAERQALKTQAEVLQTEMANIQKRLD
ncbi:DUF5320 domain-containing protein, partial [candidate division FCPU426 bacterium]|nr:DUF5320 domain-containing protein [candidate division FCPU426 bacterium]